MGRIPQQVVPLIILFAAGVALLMVARHFLVPKTFGQYGYYRAEAANEVAAMPISYGGSQTCGECHTDIADLKLSSKHRGVACEVCHGPAKNHAEAPDEFTPAKPTGRGYCPICHGYNPSRPSGFPQILPVVHNPGKACMTCHNPHNPTLPHPPEECSACHREIASKKMVSHHAGVACTVCHSTPSDHWQNPLSVLAKKPTTRELCGQCHARGAESSKEIPRIDLDTHGGRYLCWDCHYPHYPEAKP